MKTKLAYEKTPWLFIGVLWFAGISAAMQLAKFSVAFDAIQVYYNATPALVGFSFSIIAVIGLVFSPSAGMTVSRTNYYYALIVALIIGALCSIIQAFMPPMSMVLLSRFIEGISNVIIVVTVPTIMASLSAARHRAIVMGLWGAFSGVAFVLMAWLGLPILMSQGIGTLFLIHGLLIIGLAGCIAVMLKNFPIDRHTRQPAKLHLKMFIKDNIAVYTNPRTFLPGFIFLFHSCMFIALLTFLPRLLENQNASTFLFGALPLASIAGTFCAGALAQYFLLSTSIAAIAYSIIATGAIIIYWVAGADYGLVLASIGLIFASGAIQGSTFATVPVLARDPSERARANGVISQTACFGIIVGLPIFASVIDTRGVFGLMVAVLILCAFGIAVSLYTGVYIKTRAIIDAEKAT